MGTIHTPIKEANEPIAVVGSACRFPGSLNTPSMLWDFLCKPHDLLTKISNERFNPDAFYHPDGMHHGTSNVKESYLLREDHRAFDAGFFNIKPVEAHSIDPQQRLLMETVYESLEAAGMSIESLAGSQTGVYVGLMCGDFSEHLQRDPQSLPTYMPTGTARSIISNRVSYFFDWHGPSMTIDTACSSSLVAVHQAVQQLRSGESDVVIAAGANLILGPELYIGEAKLKMLSADSRSRMWDVDADGYARGEGIASVVLKRLSAALQDGDHIECVIREIGVNQDGRTKGITMPNELAQADLIERTYLKAGLNPKDKNQRCQFFEAHGTGTSAGDAREAEGISRAFFGHEFGNSDVENVLYVGSIKTVIGHTEGTAGLAGLLKASLAVQHGIIPPNMLFNSLNPTVSQFYNNLEIVTTAKQWPKVEGPRRASVNSFGFGGTNCHVIVESFEDSSSEHEQVKEVQVPFTPFVFSAASEKALEANLMAYSSHLRLNPDLNLGDFAFTLHSRRSALGVRAAFAARSSDSLCAAIDERIQLHKTDTSTPLGVRPNTAAPSILVVFTGQGAQWPEMGRQLILSSAFVRKSLEELDQTLQDLPDADRPSWSLVEQLLADRSHSRVGEAAISQPLCTALQIVLVELLRAAGISFKAVVGHSSGEIAAAYAAAFISREDAIKIAFYRGLVAKYAGQDRPGAMMAVGTSFDDANDLCALDTFEGRLSVAACNSSSSVTLSGDADAIEEARFILAEEKKFVRTIKVDKAYHSHHMLPCAEPYVSALLECNIEPKQPKTGSCHWYSSTYQGIKMEAQDELKGVYWKDNMVNPVLFSQAIEAAASNEDPFNLVIEVGPHHALKGPVLQTLQDTYGQSILYTGLLSRDKHDVESYANALGYFWSHFSPTGVELGQYDDCLSGGQKRQIIPSLPSYQWDHDRTFWHETRLSRAHRNRKDPYHPLLGSRTLEGTESEMRWRNILRPSELPWVHGHQLQGQMVFPATGYIATAIEAAKYMVKNIPICLIEVCDFVIGKPLTFDDDQSGVEMLFTLSDISKNSSGLYSASFRYHAWTNQESDTLSLLASGCIVVTIDETSSSNDVLPPRSPEQPNMASVREDQFYASLDDLGYGYSGDFRCLSSMKRKLNYGSAYVSVPQQEAVDAVLVHPAFLDVGFQSIFLAYGWPNDGSLDQLHVPRSISRIRINFALCQKDLVPGTQLQLDSHLTDNPLTAGAIRGDVDIFGADGQSTLIQVQGIQVVGLSDGSPQLDRQLYSEHIWGLAIPDAQCAADNRATPEDYELAWSLERVSIFYMKKLQADIKPEERINLEWYHHALFDFVSHILSKTEKGKQRFAKREWLDDTWEQILEIMTRIEMKLTRTVGENLAAAVRGETNILQHLLADGLLNKYYTDAMGLKETTEFLAKSVAQVVHRYPHMKILEIGAGTGGATKSIMRDIGRSFSSYTYTDISTGFFETAKGIFAQNLDRMIFKALDIEKDILEQGYAEHSYDLIIGSLVLHATSSLRKTMENTRRLLKPGGYLIILEIISNDVIRTGFAMSGLPGWWLGRNDGRRFSPCVSSAEWHNLLVETGFSGIDSLSPETDILPRPLSVIISQAVDDQVNLLREPLQYPGQTLGNTQDWDLVIIGGETLRTIKLIDEVIRLLQPWYLPVTRIRSLHDTERLSNISAKSVVLSVTELDQPIFLDFSPETMEGLKRLLGYQRTILWVTQGCRVDEPYMNMTVGFCRTLALEAPDTQLQLLDLDISRRPDARLLAESLLRLNFTQVPEVLWSVEQEIVQEAGKLLIPRLILNQEQNNRYNAARRTIFDTKDVRQTPVILQPTPVGYSLVKHELDLCPNDVQVAVSHSTLVPIANSMYGIAGINISTGKSVLGFSTINGSQLAINTDRLIEYNSSKIGESSRLISLLLVEMEVDNILSVCTSDEHILLHQASAELAERLGERAHEKGLRISFTTSHGKPLDKTWITVHPCSPLRTIKATVPLEVSIFIDYSTNDDGVGTVDIDSSSHSSPVQMSPMDIAGNGKTASSTIVNWSGTTEVSVKLSSIDSQINFAPDKTYVLFGLTSDLGQSLCDWMAAHGARNIVLTSRNPKIDQRWLDQMKRTGVRLQVFCNDITDKVAVQAIVSEIRATFPPIGGIAQGAMVLEDASFFDMSFETMDKVLKPKVLGSIHLDELFQNDDLDFFIFFSSLASVSGNRGQSNYSAANMFMTALAFQRRRKGLAASVLHIGAIMGVGYVMREVSETVFPAIRRAGFTWMPERGFHQCFAEAIVSGRPQSGRSPEIVTGLRLINANEEEPAPWMNIPRFQHCIDRSGTAGLREGHGNAVVAVKTRLLVASTREEALEMIQYAFFAKLQAALQLHIDDPAVQRQVLSSGADELGFDSLVAVEIRSWFLKELEVDMPVLKILGGASVSDLLIFALDKLPDELIPKVAAIPEAVVNTSKIKKDTVTPHFSPSSVISSKATSDGESLFSPVNGSSPPQNSVVSLVSSSSSTYDKEEHFTPNYEPKFEKVVPLSFGQSRFWFLKHYHEDQTTFNITFSTRLKGPVRIRDLENADSNQQPMQGILEKSSLCLEKMNIQNSSQVAEEFEAMKNHVFDIENGEIMRVILLSLNPLNSFLIIGYHHINMDGASLEVFLRDLELVYCRKPLSQPVYQYSAFSLWQRKEIESGKMKDELQYWKSEFADPPTPLPLLPFSSTNRREAVSTYSHYRADVRINSQLAEQIKNMCSKRKTSIYHFYLSVYEAMLFRLLDTNDLCIGMADANRSEDTFVNSMGMYLNLLPLRFHLRSNMQFIDVLKETRRKAYSAMAHSRLPFDVLLDELKVPRSTLYSPLFQAFINYRLGVQEKRAFGDLECEGEEYSLGRTAYDISLDILDNQNSNTLLMFIVQTQLYSAEDARLMCNIYVSLLEQFSKDPTLRLDEPSLFAKEDIAENIQLGMGPNHNSEWPETMVHRVYQIIETFPDSIALKDTEHNELTYRQLANRIGCIVSSLLEANLEEHAPVGVFQEPSPDWVCSILAVMAIGAIYVPFDAKSPTSRLVSMMEDCQPTAVLIHDATASKFGGLRLSSRATVINLANIPLDISHESRSVAAKACDPAVILYTSGTTGVPKGVILSHESLRNENEFEVVSGPEIVLQQSAISFDLSLNQVFTALAHGGTLVIIPRSMRGDAVAIANIIAKEKVTYTGATPSEYLSWLQYGRSELLQNKAWKFAMSCGEQYPQQLANEFKRLELPHLSLWNAYGPTEATLSSNRIQLFLKDDDSNPQHIPVGYTLTNCSVYIVDRDLNPLPAGVPGEVCIGGAGVAIGYLNNKELTTEKFVPNRFANPHFLSRGWQRMYRTGDRGVLQDDGALKILGRIDGDTQIKLRGIRIEMQDIENTILREANGAISDVVVVPRGDPPVLMAHAVLSSVSPKDQTGFLQHLNTSLSLPQYMRPAAIIPIDKMPLTTHGKIDRSAVQILSIAHPSQKPSPVTEITPMENQLWQIWENVISKEVLQLHAIDGDTDFFHVGGNSMLLIKLQELIKQKFGTSLGIMRLFECSTLRTMAAAIQDASVTRSPDIVHWEEEIAFPEELSVMASSQSTNLTRKHATSPLVIILTGSTGFLGKEILQQLIALPSVQEIHCVAVRDEKKLEDMVTSSGKVVIHQGDLSLPQCGLSDQSASEIFSKADAIIHNGADVSFLKSYRSLSPSNVESTKELVRLSLRQRQLIPFHFISTVTTGRLNKSETFGEVSLSSTPPPPGFPDGYVASKWASEAFLERASTSFSLPVYIHRPSSITGEGASDLDVMHNMLKYARLTKSVPESSRWKGYIDFISVENVARGIIQEVLHRENESSTPASNTAHVRYIHHSGDIVTTVESFKDYLTNESGETFIGLPLREWVERAKEHGLNVLVAGYLTASDERQVDVVFQRLIKLKVA
ncbi:hypothetical protein UA08_04451 [Talaromyces atroroseus]|uniref:Carrier domain-containing protein n=1 Tax=Talaromyces atroroseus TaxID=1441469 RepID=A0A1Q5Q882_TALAT|nr:hypothetical protein UA08_04451 [Talaromyces atroroseus]OKL60321.1 hypothetical protein UA08_04451 [Talaromyces atroroseus]